jgi:predicted ferric reductase
MSQLVWDTARAAGFTTFLLLTLSVALGLVLSARWKGPGWPRFVTNELHRFATLLALVFLGIHIAAVWIDPFTHFSAAAVFVPFAGSYRTVWTALGIVGFYLVLAIWVSTLLRKVIGYAWWRRLHGLAFALYGFAFLHGIGAGSDSGTTWGAAIYFGSLALVAVLTVWRIVAVDRLQRTPRNSSSPASAMPSLSRRPSPWARPGDARVPPSRATR